MTHHNPRFPTLRGDGPPRLLVAAATGVVFRFCLSSILLAGVWYLWFVGGGSRPAGAGVARSGPD